MGGKPKQEDYKPSEAEKASAAVARAEKLFFNENNESRNFSSRTTSF